MRRKGQVMTWDLMIAIALFMLISIFLVFAWIDYNNRLTQRLEYIDMVSTGMQTTNLLVKSQGHPWDWDKTTAESIGISDGDREISQSKLDTLLNMTYQEMRENLKTGPYNFYFNLQRTSGQNITAGLTPAGERQYRFERYVTYGGTNAKMQITLWK